MKKLRLTIAAVMTVFLGYAQQQPAQEEISDADYHFAINASKSGIMELKLSELAITNSSSPEIKMLGTRMVANYTRVNKELKQFADQRGIYFFAGLDEKQQKYYLKLAAKKGEEFDKAYVKYMVKDHKDVIGNFEKEIKKGLDAELKDWAAAMLPVLEQQVQISEETYATISKEKSITFNY